MTRLPNWQSALDRFLNDHRETGFKYGQFDCCLFVCDAIKAMTGTDIAAPFRGYYSSRREAADVIRAYTGKASVRAIAERVTGDNGMPMVETMRLQRGDVALIRRGTRDYSVGLVSLNGSEILVATSSRTERVPLATATGGWRV